MSELVLAGSIQKTDKKIKAAFFDGDGVMLKMPEEFFHIDFAKRHGLDPNLLSNKFFGPSYNDILRGKGDFKTQIEKYRQLWGDHDPNELVAEWLEYDSNVNQPLVDVIIEHRQRDIEARKQDAGHTIVGLYMATVQEPIRFKHIKETLFPHVFDNFYGTCELGFLKVEDEDKHPETAILLDNPPAPYFTRILGGLAVAPEEIAYFDDRAENVEIARRKGISAHIYESPGQVARILEL